MTVTEATQRLARLSMTLTKIRKYDQDYEIRYQLVFQALHEALQCGIAAGVRIDHKEPQWPVVYIELSTGQVSWHMPQHPDAWDEHTTEEKYDRIDQFVAKVASRIVDEDDNARHPGGTW